jgi:hypothetical protein
LSFLQCAANNIQLVIKDGLNKLLSEHLNRYELLEKTHQAIMNLPSVLNELNQQPCNIYNSTPQFQEKEKETELKSNSIMLFTEDLIKKELDKQYESIMPLFEKMLTKIENLSKEVNELKNKNTTDNLALALTVSTPQLEVEKENIRLEIEETTEFELENDTEDEDNVEEIPAGTKLGGKTWDGDDWETDDEYEDVVEEEDIDEALEESDADDVNPLMITCSTIVLEPQSVVEEQSEEEQLDESVEEEHVDEEELQDDAELEEEDIETENSAEESEDETDEVINKEESDEVVEEDEEEELFEIDIDDVTYCTNNEENGFIYQLSEDGDVGTKVGYFKDGEPFFYADEN